MSKPNELTRVGEVFNAYICYRSAESDERGVGRFRIRGVGLDE